MVMLLYGGVARAVEGSWLSPGAYFGIVWVLAAVPPCLFASQFVSSAAVWVILSFALISLTGSQLGRRFAAFYAAKSTSSYFDDSRTGNGKLTRIVALFGLSGLLALYGYVTGGGYGIADLVSAATWLDLAVHYTGLRYGGELSEPLYVRLLVGLNYTGALLGGVLLGISREWKSRITAAFPIVVAALLTIITTAKAPLMISVLLCASGGFVIRVWRGHEGQARGKWRLGIRLLSLLACLLAIFVGSLALRYQSVDVGEASPGIIGGLQSYVFGYMGAWSAWVSQGGLWPESMTMGQLSFAGLFELLGGAVREPGIYHLIDSNDLAGSSNVFTAFRGLISDFSYAGALLICGFMSLIAGAAYSILLARRKFSWSAVYLMAYYTLIAWTPIVSILIYNSIIMAFMIAGGTISWLRPELECSLKLLTKREATQ